MAMGSGFFIPPGLRFHLALFAFPTNAGIGIVKALRGRYVPFGVRFLAFNFLFCSWMIWIQITSGEKML